MLKILELAIRIIPEVVLEKANISFEKSRTISHDTSCYFYKYMEYNKSGYKAVHVSVLNVRTGHKSFIHQSCSRVICHIKKITERITSLYSH